ncbi:type II secretion system F family protein [Candidatus Woesearchaeota archaeon]|nr:type II secretion system F family protein [Candidatus Woesearchaeota archaeon]
MKFDETFAHAGIKKPRKLIDSFLKIAIFIQAVSSLGFALIGFHLLAIISYFGVPIIALVGFFIWLATRIEGRSRQADTVLPDALQMMASNIRAGMTPDVALLLAARPEFGAFAFEIRMAAKEAMTGKTLEESLLEISKRIRSKTLSRTLNLIVEGMRSGGSLASLLEETSMDLRNALMLMREIKANVMAYFVFILMAVGLGAPMLFGVSMTMVEVMTEMTSKITIPEGASGIMTLQPSEESLDVEFINLFALAAIGITVFFGSITLGVIEAGKELDGLKYIFFLAILTYGVFFGVKALVSTIFVSII